jgi:hypothetical protein
MTKPTIRIHNTETNKVIEREMNAEEFAQWESDQAKAAVEAQAKAQAAAAKAALLDKLGITEEEAKLLLS